MFHGHFLATHLSIIRNPRELSCKVIDFALFITVIRLKCNFATIIV